MPPSTTPTPSPDVRPGRRLTWALLAIFSVIALVAAGCGSDAEPATQAAGDNGSGDEEFPVTIEHKYGETTIEEMPERVVAVGLTEQDALLALGIAPVATTEWFGEQPGAVWPWAQDELKALGAKTPEVLSSSDAVNVEAVAAQRPDLILAIYSGLKQGEYDKLSSIAPTVAQPKDNVDYGVSWQDLTTTVGAAVGKAEEAGALVADVEQQFADVREEHPEFDGKTAVMATPWEGIFVYGPEDPRGRLLEAIGFSLPADLAKVTGDEFGGNLAEENVDLIDVDSIVWLDAEEAKNLGGPGYEKLKVHTEGREVHLNSFDDPLGAATSFVSVLSLPFLLDGLTPKLTAAVDGDPATATQ